MTVDLAFLDSARTNAQAVEILERELDTLRSEFGGLEQLSEESAEERVDLAARIAELTSAWASRYAAMCGLDLPRG